MKIGYVVILAESKRFLKNAPRYADIRKLALRAEEVGFDSIWLYDHLLYRNNPEEGTIGIWECWTMLSALAEATSRIELGTLVNCISFRNPAILAKMAATLDEVSQGRFTLGIGAGWNKPEYEAFGMPFDHLASRFEEAVQIIQPLLKKGRVDFNGTYYQANDCEIRPRGPSHSGPRILIGADQPRMLRLTARYADLWNSAYYGAPETFQENLSHFRTACAEVGRDPTTIGVTALVYYLSPKIGELPGFDQPHLTGSPEDVAAALHGYEAMGVDQVIFHVIPGGMRALDLLAKGVQAYRQEQLTPTP